MSLRNLLKATGWLGLWVNPRNVRTDCVLDSSLILSVVSADAFQLLWHHPTITWHISGVVRGELRQRASREPVDAAIAAGQVQLVELDTADPAQLQEWARWLRLVDRGEAEAIAIAATRNWLVAVEDRQAQRAIDTYLGQGRWVNCASLLVSAMDGARLSLAEADRIFSKLDCHAGYVKAGLAKVVDLIEYAHRTSAPEINGD